MGQKEYDRLTSDLFWKQKNVNKGKLRKIQISKLEFEKLKWVDRRSSREMLENMGPKEKPEIWGYQEILDEKMLVSMWDQTV